MHLHAASLFFSISLRTFSCSIYKRVERGEGGEREGREGGERGRGEREGREGGERVGKEGGERRGGEKGGARTGIPRNPQEVLLCRVRLPMGGREGDDNRLQLSLH